MSGTERQDGRNGQEKALRVRNLLAGYYGRGESNPETAGVTNPSTPESTREPLSRVSGASSGAHSSVLGASPLDLPGFNPDVFVSNMMQKLRLRDLMAAHIAMAHEVRTLDSELQTLVYQNYSKFLDSTDNIRAMRKELGSMGDRLKSLRGGMREVAELSRRVDAKIRPHRESVDQLGEIRSVLRRLDAVFTLPSKIRIALDRGSVHVAAASYARVRPVLDSLGHQGGLRAVVAECKPLVERMKGMLRERLVQGDDQALSLLQDLGDDVELLAKQVLLSAVGDATRALERTSRSAAALMRCDERGLVPRTAAARTQRTDEASYATKARTEGGEGTSPPSEAQALVKWLLDNVLGALEAGLERHAALFPSGDLGGAAGDVRKVIGALMLQISACLCGVVPSTGRVVAAASGSEPLGQLVSSGAMWQVDFRAQDLVDTLRHACGAIASCKRLADAGVNPAAAASVLAGLCARRHVAGCTSFGPRVALVCLCDGAAPRRKPDELAEALERARVALRSGMESAIKALRPVFAGDPKAGPPLPHDMPKWAAACCSQAVVDFFAVAARLACLEGDPHDRQSPSRTASPSAWMRGEALDSPPSRSDSWEPWAVESWEWVTTAAGAADRGRLALLASRLAAAVHEGGIPDRLADALRAACPGAVVAPDGPDVIAASVDRSRALLRHWVETRGRAVSLELRDAVPRVASGKASPSAGGLSPVGEAVCAGVRRAAEEAGALVQERGGTGATAGVLADWSGPPLHRMASVASPRGFVPGSIEMEMEKMFRGRVRVFGPVEPTQGSLISAVARIALKSLVELLREQRIAAAEAVPELQLDMAAVACEIAPLVGAGNATTLASFLDDAATALATRGGAQGVLPPKEVTERLAMWRRARESSGIS